MPIRPRAATPPATSAADMSRWSDAVRRVEWAIFALGCATLVGLQIVGYRHAGAFWRDEATTLLVAASPSFALMWSYLGFDSFPAVFASTVKLWMLSGLGGSEAGLRLLGTAIALAMVPAAFFCCRELRDDAADDGWGRAPVLALALVLLNSSVAYYGSSLRAYGLATIAMLLALAFVWRVIRDGSRRSAAAAVGFTLLSVQTLYQNAAVVFAIGGAGVVACAARRRWKRAAAVLAVCAIAAASLLVYVPTIRSYGATTGIGTDTLRVKTSVVASRFVEALSGKSDYLLALWVLLGVFVLAVMTSRALQPRDESRRDPSLQVFCIVMAALAAGAGFVFFRMSGNLPWSWHFIPFIALAGVIIDVGSRPSPRSFWLAAARVTLACVVIAVSLPTLWTYAHRRRTNIDVVAQRLVTLAAPEDLIVVNPFWYSAGFYYYYHGSADWMTLPAIPTDRKSRVGPFGPYRVLMATPNAIEPALRRIQATLDSGKVVWVVGTLLLLRPRATPPVLSPAPDPEYGWSYEAYFTAWTMQMGHVLQQRQGVTFQKYHFPLPQPVDPLEDVELTRIAVANVGARGTAP